MTKLKKNLVLSKLQQKVDELQIIADASIRLHADNRDILQYDLKMAKQRLVEAQQSQQCKR